MQLIRKPTIAALACTVALTVFILPHILPIKPKKFPASTPTAAAANGRKEIVYRDISHCLPKPEYFPMYKGHCWGRCNKQQVCNVPASQTDVIAGRATLHCIANVHLVGVRKCATTDFTKWLMKNEKITYHLRDFRVLDENCPIEWFENCYNIKFCDKRYKPETLKVGFFQSSPGNILINGQVNENSTHITIATAMQYLGHMATPETIFYVQLRNPTDRAISYFYHWHTLHSNQRIFTNMTVQQMDAKFMDGLLRRLLKDLKDCIGERGDFYCAFRSTGRDGDLDCLLPHSMYSVYIKEAFKFIPRSQFRFNTTDEYSVDPAGFARQFAQKYFHVGIPEKLTQETYSKKKDGKKNVLWISTLKLLDDFYEPYSRELAQLLGDSKYLFPVDRDAQS
ncbi:uncharacterized protein [Watersipora subatra]|uniref:uncharacterized protein n=1 Tax=Watersipora subatra TaxID=2589382 RepID=UPI00355BF372